MRRTIPFVVAVVAAIVAMLAVMAGIGIGQTTSSHGGTPSEVFMSTYDTKVVCNEGGEVRKHRVRLVPTAVSVGEQSHVLAYFTATLSHYELNPELLLALQIEGTDIVESSPEWIERGGGGHSTVTVMWTFQDIAAGDYTVRASARLPGLLAGAPGANLQACALTVFVVPAVQ